MTKSIICGVALAAFVCLVLVASPVLASQGSAQAAINQAENTLKNCYDAFLEAEAAGANVDSLAVTLNRAALNLSNADLAYQGGNYDAAYTHASQVQNGLSGFEVRASSLKQDALAAKGISEMVLASLLAGSTALVCFGVAIWVVLDRKDRRNRNDAVPV